MKVIYTSDFTIDETSENVWVDKEAETEDGQVYIVIFYKGYKAILVGDRNSFCLKRETNEKNRC